MKHPSLAAMLLVSSLSAAALAAPLSVPLITEKPEALWSAESSRIEVTTDEAGTVLRWHLEAGQSSTLALRPESGLLAQLRHYDYARLELRIASGEVANVNLRLLGHVSGPRQYKVHDWQVAILTTARGLWHPRCFELARPNWFPWDNADGEGTDVRFQFQALALAPGTVVELRGLTLTRAVIRLKPDFHPPITWPVLTRDAAGNAVLTLQHHVQNMANRQIAIEAEIASAHPRFQVAVAFGEKADAAAARRAVTPTLKNGATAVFTVTATLPADAVAATPELYAEALQLRFRPAGEPESEVWWRGELVRPLSDTVRAQVILAPESVALIREHLPDDAALAKALGSPAILAGADAGFAILRQGDTAAEQVMATLDYGRNTMHAHLDRNTLTLSAFGHLYSHGPGTLYNVGRGGMTRVSDPKLESFCGSGSLGQNVILIDRQNQRPAIGERLAWHVSPERQVVAARVPALAPGADHTRALVLSRGIVVVLDRVSADRERLVDFVYHNFGEQRPGDGWTSDPETEPLGATANYANLVDPHRLRGSGPVRLQWQVTETAHLALWQLPPPGATAYTAVTGMNNPQKKIIPDRAPSLITRAQGQIVHFLTVLEPHRGQPRVTAVEPLGGDGLLVRFADGPDLRLVLDELLAMPETNP